MNLQDLFTMPLNNRAQLLDMPTTELKKATKITTTPQEIRGSMAEVKNTIHKKDHNLLVSRTAEIGNTSASRSLADRALTLQELKKYVTEFNGCALKQVSTNTVFGDGVSHAKIMLIGEAPGATEDEKAIPFCGESGKLLDNMLQTIGLYRHINFYITNTVFWRPPANRAPTQEEIEICRPFVEKHIALIRPKLLILVGSTAVSSLLGNHLQISKIRKEDYMYSNQYLDTPVATKAIFHPAYLLRQPMQKKASWYDLLQIKDEIQEYI